MSHLDEKVVDKVMTASWMLSGRSNASVIPPVAPRFATRQHFVEDDAEGKNVGLWAGNAGLQGLWCRVPWRAEPAPGKLRAPQSSFVADSEVAKDGIVFRIEENIRRFDIPVINIPKMQVSDGSAEG